MLTELVLPKWKASWSKSLAAIATLSGSEPDSPYKAFSFSLSEDFPFPRVPTKPLAAFNHQETWRAGYFLLLSAYFGLFEVI